MAHDPDGTKGSHTYLNKPGILRIAEQKVSGIVRGAKQCLCRWHSLAVCAINLSRLPIN